MKVKLNYLTRYIIWILNHEWIPQKLETHKFFAWVLFTTLFYFSLKSHAAFHRDEEKIKVNFEKRQSSIEHKQFDCKKSAGIRVVSCVWPPGEAPSHSIHWGRPPTKREEHTKNPHFFSTFLSQWFSKIGKMGFSRRFFL